MITKNYKLFIPILILIVSYQIGELYTFWDAYDKKVYNWFWLVDIKRNIAWNVKYSCEEINRVLEAIAFYLIARHSKDKTYCITAQVYMIYRCLDVPYYFINFKTDWYNTIWVLLAIIELWLTSKSKKKHIFTNNKAG